MNINELLSAAEKLADKVPPEVLRGLSGEYNLHVTGENGCCIHARISGGRISLEPGECAGALCTAETDSAALDALLAGKLSPAAAVLTGRVRVTGSAGGLSGLAALRHRLR